MTYSSQDKARRRVPPICYVLLVIVRAVDEVHRTPAARLYWQAFGRKLGPVLGPPERGIGLIERTRAMVAVDGDELLGLAGFHLNGRSLVGLEARDVWREFGWFGGSWRTLLLGSSSGSLGRASC